MMPQLGTGIIRMIGFNGDQRADAVPSKITSIDLQAELVAVTRQAFTSRLYNQTPPAPQTVPPDTVPPDYVMPPFGAREVDLD